VSMGYEYIKKAYGVAPVVGQQVKHEVTRKLGKITRESRSASHYVMVRFEGCNHSLPCHPLELGLSPAPPTNQGVGK
jgi:hypothetical protein